MTSKRISILILSALLAFAGLLGGLEPAPPVLAQGGSASDLIAAVNALRAAYGLEPYQVDGNLMSLAQTHSDYMASVATCTHDGADGSTPATRGISAENVACGSNLSVDGAIYYQWANDLHTATLIGPDSGWVGAGVAVADGSVYYTLDVKRGSGSFVTRPPLQTATEQGGSSSGGVSTGAATAKPLPTLGPPLMTSTVNPDGSLVHLIRLNETLVQIAKAYGITLEQIYAANPWLDAKNPVYYEGQKLLIHAAFTPTPTASQTGTPPPPSATPRPTRTATPLPSLTPTDSPTPTLPVSEQVLAALEPNRRTIATGVVVFSAIGVLAILFLGFRKGKAQPSGSRRDDK